MSAPNSSARRRAVHSQTLGQVTIASVPQSGQVQQPTGVVNASVPLVNPASVNASARPSATPGFVPALIYTGKRWNRGSRAGWFQMFVPAWLRRLFTSEETTDDEELPIFVYLDTCILVIADDLEDLKSELMRKFGPRCQLVLSYTVLHELGELAKSAPQVAVKQNAANANRITNRWLTGSDPNVIGEVKKGDLELKSKGYGISIKTNDDKIVVGCVDKAMTEPDGRVVLFTADRNLQSKAIVSGIDAVINLLEPPTAIDRPLNVTQRMKRVVFNTICQVLGHVIRLRTHVRQLLFTTATHPHERQLAVMLLGTLIQFMKMLVLQYNRVIGFGDKETAAEFLFGMLMTFGDMYNLKLPDTTAADFLQVLSSDDAVLKQKVTHGGVQIDGIYAEVILCRQLLFPDEDERIS